MCTHVWIYVYICLLYIDVVAIEKGAFGLPRLH